MRLLLRTPPTMAAAASWLVWKRVVDERRYGAGTTWATAGRAAGYAIVASPTSAVPFVLWCGRIVIGNHKNLDDAMYQAHKHAQASVT